jgi:hypothetical protein
VRLCGTNEGGVMNDVEGEEIRRFMFSSACYNSHLGNGSNTNPIRPGLAVFLLVLHEYRNLDIPLVGLSLVPCSTNSSCRTYNTAADESTEVR